MIIQGKPFIVKKLSTENAAVKIKFSEQEIVENMYEETKKMLTKLGKNLVEDENQGITIEGDFVMINEGSRWLRYLVGPFGVGSAKLEVEGTIKERDHVIKNFHYKEKGYGGIGGGAAKVLLSHCCKKMVKKMKDEIKQLDKD